jgi:hypothetical protein
MLQAHFSFQRVGTNTLLAHNKTIYSDAREEKNADNNWSFDKN